MKILSREVLFENIFIRLVEKIYKLNGDNRKWYGVERTNVTAAVTIAAITKEKEVILVRQPRPMIGVKTIEFPAGLLDIEGENMIETAKRELMEETGYDADSFELIIGGEKGLPVSPGLTDERLSLVIARGAFKVAEPLQNEGTEPILVSLDKAFKWLEERSREEEIEFKALLITRFVENLERR